MLKKIHFSYVNITCTVIFNYQTLIQFCWVNVLEGKYLL